MLHFLCCQVQKLKSRRIASATTLLRQIHVQYTTVHYPTPITLHYADYTTLH